MTDMIQMGECRVLVTMDPVEVRGRTKILWHLSISHPNRYPTWDEIKEARERFLPANLSFAMRFPPASEPYVNMHTNCFHLWEEA
jgi:hypothetical protein